MRTKLPPTHQKAHETTVLRLACADLTGKRGGRPLRHAAGDVGLDAEMLEAEMLENGRRQPSTHRKTRKLLSFCAFYARSRRSVP